MEDKPVFVFKMQFFPRSLFGTISRSTVLTCMFGAFGGVHYRMNLEYAAGADADRFMGQRNTGLIPVCSILNR